MPNLRVTPLSGCFLFLRCNMNPKILLATSNAGKIKELQQLLAPRPCISQQSLNIDSPPETGTTFIENAIIKARHASMHANMPAVADDSGLVIPTLNGEPGIYSSRYAGEGATDADNIQKVLRKISEVTPPIKAYFYCAIVYIEYADSPTPTIGTGMLHGEIVKAAAGTHGFGYDPIFYVPEHNATLAELGPEVKQKISHRAEALRMLGKKLASCYDAQLLSG